MHSPPSQALLDRAAYFDTIQVWLAEPLTRQEYQAVQAACGSVAPSYTKSLRPMRWRPCWKQRLRLNQPTTEAIRLLRGRTHLVNEAHLALDWCCTDTDHARDLDCYLRKHLVMRWAGKRKPNAFMNSTYWSGRRNFALYSDRSSRLNGHPHVVHLELGASGKANVERAGITSLDDVLAFDHRNFWTDRLQLREADLDKLMEVTEPPQAPGFWKRRRDPARRRQIVLRAMRWGCETYGPALPDGAAQNVLAAGYPYDVTRRVLTPLDATWLLPERWGLVDECNGNIPQTTSPTSTDYIPTDKSTPVQRAKLSTEARNQLTEELLDTALGDTPRVYRPYHVYPAPKHLRQRITTRTQQALRNIRAPRDPP